MKLIPTPAEALKWPRFSFSQDSRRVLSESDILKIKVLKSHGMSQREVAKAIGCSKTIVAYYTSPAARQYHNKASKEYVEKRRKNNPEAICLINQRRRIKKYYGPLHDQVLAYYRIRSRAYDRLKRGKKKMAPLVIKEGMCV